MTRREGRRIQWIGLVVLVAGLAGHALLYDYIVDDAFISFRYAQNLILGSGLVYNPGERVEGYTNFLWVMLVALGMRFGADPVVYSQLLGFLSAAGVLAVLFFWPRASRTPGSKLRWLAPALCCLSPPFALWAVGGLETSLFTLLVFAGMALAVRQDLGGSGYRAAGAGLCLALATLTRPEGLLAGIVVAADLLLRPPPGRGRRSRFLPVFLAVWLVVVASHELWRWAYYGALLPNSFHAKVGWSGAQVRRGILYLLDFARTSAWLAMALAVLPLRSGLRHRTLRLPFLWGASYTAYVIAVGGDGLSMYRFFVPVLPSLYLLAEEGISTLGRRVPWGSAPARRWAAVALCLVLGVVTVGPSIASSEKEFVQRDKIFVERHWTAVGKWLRQYAKPGESIAVTTAGAVAFYSGLYTIDMLGINEPAIARREMPEMGTGIAGHEKYDMAYVLSRRPTYLFHHLFLLTRRRFSSDQFVTPWNPGEAELLTNETFQEIYEPVTEKVGRFYLNFYRLKRSDGDPDGGH